VKLYALKLERMGKHWNQERRKKKPGSLSSKDTLGWN